MARSASDKGMIARPHNHDRWSAAQPPQSQHCRVRPATQPAVGSEILSGLNAKIRAARPSMRGEVCDRSRNELIEGSSRLSRSPRDRDPAVTADLVAACGVFAQASSAGSRGWAGKYVVSVTVGAHKIAGAESAFRGPSIPLARWAMMPPRNSEPEPACRRPQPPRRGRRLLPRTGARKAAINKRFRSDKPREISKFSMPFCESSRNSRPQYSNSRHYKHFSSNWPRILGVDTAFWL